MTDPSDRRPGGPHRVRRRVAGPAARRLIFMVAATAAIAHGDATAQATMYATGGATIPTGTNSFSTGWLIQGGLLFTLAQSGASTGVVGLYGQNGPGTPDQWLGGLGVLEYVLGDSDAAAPFFRGELGLVVLSEPNGLESELDKATSLGLGFRTAPKSFTGFVQASWTRLSHFNFIELSAGMRLVLQAAPSSS